MYIELKLQKQIYKYKYTHTYINIENIIFTLAVRAF